MSSSFVLAIFQESLHVLHANLIFPFMHNNRQMLFLHKPNSQVSVYLGLMTHFSSMKKSGSHNRQRSHENTELDLLLTDDDN